MLPERAAVAEPPLSSAPLTTTPRATGSLRWWLIGLVVVADQASKLAVQAYIPLFDTVTIIAGLVDLVHIHNAGVAFGIFNDAEHPYRSLFTTTLAVVALAGIVYYARQVGPDERLARTGLSLILGGAVGNLIDRVRLGHVIDFIDVYQGNWHFWAFNVADAAITCGAVMIFADLLFSKRHASHPV